MNGLRTPSLGHRERLNAPKTHGRPVSVAVAGLSQTLHNCLALPQGPEKASPGTMSNNAGAPTSGQGYARLWPPLAKSGGWPFSRDRKPASWSPLPKNCFLGPPRSATGSPVAPLQVVPEELSQSTRNVAGGLRPVAAPPLAPAPRQRMGGRFRGGRVFNPLANQLPTAVSH
jgi:hypothetical protein